MSDPVTVTHHGGVAVVTLNNPPVNALSHAVRVALTACLKALFGAAEVQAIVIACEGRTFIAGADIREFGKPPLDPDLPELVELLDTAPKPTIAAIHGTALGGGLELALACHFRIATESAKLGLPEVTLGILPGAGGTQRLPRLIGVKPALEMIISGTPVSATRAREVGLLDELVADPLRQSAVDFAQGVLSQGRPRRRVSELTATLDDADELAAYEHRIAERSRGFLAPLRCITAVRGAVQLPFDQGLELERELFKQLMASSESKAQRHVFFGEREVAKIPGLPDDTSTRTVKSVAVVGTGPAAGSVAATFADARIPVILIADTQEDLEGALAPVRASYAGAVRDGRLSQTERDSRLERIRATLSYDDARDADLLIECAPDELSDKRAALVRLDVVAKPTAILASSTALCDLDLLAAATSRPSDVVALHLTSPLEPSKLLECVRGSQSSPESFATVMKLGRGLGRVAVPVRGHVARRLMARRRAEALSLLEEGALPEDVDDALTEFGFPLGPFAALDLEGLQSALVERKATLANLSRRERSCTLFEELVLVGRLGRSAGAGFYRYDDGRASPDPALATLLEAHSTRQGIPRRAISREEITSRCVYGIINEAARLLDEGLAARPLDIDMIMVHGCGFPIYRGGPLFFADLVGLGELRARMLELRERLGDDTWSPAPLIERLAADQRGFYPAPR